MTRLDRRTMIVLTAGAAFTARGYAATTVGEIAQALGISKAAISYYFPAKVIPPEELLRPLIDDLTAVLDRHPSPVWPSGIRSLLHEYATVLINSIDLARWA